MPDYINCVKRRGEALIISAMLNELETIYSCYVLDGGRKLVGSYHQELILADDNNKVSDIMKEDIIRTRR